MLSLSACHDDGPVVPAATTKHVMVTITEPSSKQIFEAAAEPPGDDASWTNIQSNAQATSDSAKRLIRAVRGGNKDTWVQLANAMAEAADKVAAAAAAKDANALATAGDTLFASCENCHKAFQPQQKKSG
jgi:cytochrome c556